MHTPLHLSHPCQALVMHLSRPGSEFPVLRLLSAVQNWGGTGLGGKVGDTSG